MAEIDPVILKLIADNKTYLAELGNTTRKVDQLLGTQEKRAKRLEAEMKRSSSNIALSLRGLAGALGTYFTGRELFGLIDSFTRFQNQLKVAGLEGEALGRVQERLRAIGAQYGVELEALASVFNRASLAQKELGASTEDIIRLNEIVAASLKVTGASAEQARGALLQLSQSLGQDVVRAEEFNSILEGALPVAQAAARGIERMGGSVAKLRGEVIKGNVSSKEFFEGILKGGTETIKQAESATLTLGGAFTVLRNELSLYVGEASKTNGVTAALSSGIKALADNLDIIIPALAIIAGYLGVRFVAAGLAAVRTSALVSTALFAIQARAIGAATSMEALALAGGTAGRTLLAAFGGHVGLAILAIGAAIYLVNQRTDDLDEAVGRYKAGLETSNQITNKARELSEKLATARGKERDATLEALRIERARAAQALVSAKNDVIAAKAALARAQAVHLEQSQRQGFGRGVGGMGMDPGGISSSIAGIPERQGNANLNAANEAVANIESGLASLNSIIAGATAGTSAPSGTGKTKKDTGPTADEIAARFNAELASIADQALSAQISMATSAEERAELEGRAVELARARLLAEIDADKDYSATQKERLKAAVEVLAFEQNAAIEMEKNRQLEQEAADLAEERFRAEQDALRAQYDLADTDAERKDIALKIFDAEEAYLRSKLVAIELSETANDAERERARIAREALDASSAARREGASRANETEVERYLRHLNPSVAKINESLDAIKIDGLESLNDGLVDAIMGTKSLGEAFTDVANQIISDLLRIAIQQAVIKPLAESLFGDGAYGGAGSFEPGGGGLGGLGGIFGSVLGGIFGRAGGGYVGPGQVHRVNEGASPGRVEAFMSRDGGSIIPLGKMNAMRAPANDRGGDVTVRLMLSDDLDGRIENISTGVSVEVVRAAAPEIVRASVNEGARRAARPKL